MLTRCSGFRFCVSWYPICQIPSTARTRSCQAAFLTYHSLGKLVSQTYATDMANGLHRIICPIVGLLGYKDQVVVQLALFSTRYFSEEKKLCYLQTLIVEVVLILDLYTEVYTVKNSLFNRERSGFNLENNQGPNQHQTVPGKPTLLNS